MGHPPTSWAMRGSTSKTPQLTWAIQKAWVYGQGPTEEPTDFKCWQELDQVRTRWHTGESSYSNWGGQQGAQGYSIFVRKKKKLKCPTNTQGRARFWSICNPQHWDQYSSRRENQKNSSQFLSFSKETMTIFRHLKYPIWYQWKYYIRQKYQALRRYNPSL